MQQRARARATRWGRGGDEDEGGGERKGEEKMQTLKEGKVGKKAGVRVRKPLSAHSSIERNQTETPQVIFILF